MVRTSTFAKDTVNQRLKGRFSTEETVNMMCDTNDDDDENNVIELDDD